MLRAHPVGGGRRSGGFPVVSIADFEKCADPVGADSSGNGLVVSIGIASGVRRAELGRRLRSGLHNVHSRVASAFDGADSVSDVHGTDASGVGSRGSVLVRDDVVGLIAFAGGERHAD